MSDLNQVLVFEIDGLSYGLNIQDIREIIRMQEMTSLPNTSPLMEGLIRYRENLCTIFNLRYALGLPIKEHEENQKMVILYGEKIGFIVDDVTEIITVNQEEIKSIDNLEALKKTRFIDCLIESKEKLITVLRIQDILHHYK